MNLPKTTTAQFLATGTDRNGKRVKYLFTATYYIDNKFKTLLAADKKAQEFADAVGIEDDLKLEVVV